MLRTAKLLAQALEEPVYSAQAPELIAETEIHALLQTLREDAGLNKTELARRLGITPPAITRLEKRPAQASGPVRAGPLESGLNQMSITA